jgi:SAM-dependent methyltransferase
MKIFEDLIDVDLDSYSEEISPLRAGELASEYNKYIGDYSANNLAVTNRKILPYLASETHGPNCYNSLLDYLEDRKHKSFLDLGCGSGELLSKIENRSPVCIDLYGCSIHTGEVKYAREVFGLANIIPGDMRNASTIFGNYRFDCILLHCVLQFINEEERIELLLSLSKILNKDGEIIVVDYKDNDCSKMPITESILEEFSITNINSYSRDSIGNIVSFKKK